MPTTTKSLDALGEGSLMDLAIRAFVIFALAGCLLGWLGCPILAAICLAVVLLCGGAVILLDARMDELRLGREQAGFLRMEEESRL